MKYHKLLKVFLITGTLLYMSSCKEEYKIEPSKFFIKYYGGFSPEKGADLQQTPDGGFIILGTTQSFGNGGSDIYLVKVDAEGNEQWSETFGGPLNDEGKSVKLTQDGGYIIMGNTVVSETFDNGPREHTNIIIIKINASGS